MELVPVTPEHVECLARTLKPDHQRELAWYGKGSREGVRESARLCGGHALSAVHGGELLFVAGVQRAPWLHDDAAVITYLATTNFDRHVRPALRMTRHLFAVEAWRRTDKACIEQYLPPPYVTGIRFLEKMFGWMVGGIELVPTSIGVRQAVRMYFRREE